MNGNKAFATMSMAAIVLATIAHPVAERERRGVSDAFSLVNFNWAVKTLCLRGVEPWGY
jgi:hypothetical protein